MFVGGPRVMFSLGRVLQRQYGDHFTLYLRLGRFVLEINTGLDRKENT